MCCKHETLEFYYFNINLLDIYFGSECRGGGLPALYNQCVQWVCTDDVCVCLNVCLRTVSFSFKCYYLLK